MRHVLADRKLAGSTFGRSGDWPTVHVWTTKICIGNYAASFGRPLSVNISISDLPISADGRVDRQHMYSVQHGMGFLKLVSDSL